MGTVKKEQPTTENPTLARTVKKENQFERTLKTSKLEEAINKEPKRRSVREELNEIKEDKKAKHQQQFRQPAKSINHKKLQRKNLRKRSDNI